MTQGNVPRHIFQELCQPKHVKYEPQFKNVLALKTRKLWSLSSLSVADSQSLIQCLCHERASMVRCSLLHIIFHYALPSCRPHRQGVRKVRFSAARRERSRSQMRHYHYELMKTTESSNFEMISGEGDKLELMSRSAD